MELNVQDWKEFVVGHLFRLEPTKGVVSDELIEGNDIPYIGAKHETNGYMMMCQKNGFKDWVSDGNCIVFVQLGAGSAGYVNYLPTEFIGMSGKTICGYIDGIMNAYIGLFLETILCQERPKYNFGRSWTGDRLKDTRLELPIKLNINGEPLIDSTKRFSDDGYVPDWQFMEDYIKSLHHKPITTKVKTGNIKDLEIDKWEEFKVSSLFTLLNGKGITKEEIEENSGTFVAVQSGEENNGILGKIDKQYCIKMGYTLTDKMCLTVARTGSAGFVSFQSAGCVVGDSAKILLLDDNIVTTNIYLFLQTILTANRFKYDYGRKVTEDKYLADIIKLPIQRKNNGNPIIDNNRTYSDKGFIPDWQFMEDYINSLLYSDRI